MNCKNCGAEMPEQSSFCSKCGHDLRGISDKNFIDQLTVKIELPKKIKMSHKLKKSFSKNIQSSKIQLAKKTKELHKSVKSFSERNHSKNIKLIKKVSEFYKKLKELYKLKRKNYKNTHPKVSVIILGWTWVTEENYTYVRGSVKNIGNKEVKYFEVNVKYKDLNKNVLDSDFTKWDRKVQPGECKEFEIKHQVNNNYQNIDISVNNYK